MIKKILVMFIVFVTTLITFGSCSNKIRNIALKYMEEYIEKYDLKDNDIMT